MWHDSEEFSVDGAPNASRIRRYCIVHPRLGYTGCMYRVTCVGSTSNRYGVMSVWAEDDSGKRVSVAV